MTIKMTIQKKLLLVRRWKYTPERKRNMPTTLYTINKYAAELNLPDDVVKEHSVSKEEQQEYTDFVSGMNNDCAIDCQKSTLKCFNYRLGEVKIALENRDLLDELTLDQYKEIAEKIAEVKKLVTYNKGLLTKRVKK